MSDIYNQVKVAHATAVNRRFPLMTYGMKEETAATVFPDTFKRYFVRLLKTLNTKKRALKDDRQVMKYFKVLPTTFIVVGSGKRCTIHETGCLDEFCAYATFNKKVTMTRDFVKIKAKGMNEQKRQRIFYRKDYQDELKKIFMTYSDMVNCKFEPNVGSLNPSTKFQTAAGKKPDEDEGPFTEKKFNEKFGENLTKRHPQIYKQGVLKKALLVYNQGDFEKALTTLGKAFNINSLKSHFDIKWRERE